MALGCMFDRTGREWNCGIVSEGVGGGDVSRVKVITESKTEVCGIKSEAYS